MIFKNSGCLERMDSVILIIVFLRCSMLAMINGIAHISAEIFFQLGVFCASEHTDIIIIQRIIPHPVVIEPDIPLIPDRSR